MPTKQKTYIYLPLAAGRHQRNGWPRLFGMAGRDHRNTHFLTEQTVDDYNELQIRQCRRQIFSSTNEFDAFRKLCSDEPEICEPNNSRFPVEVPEIEKMLADLVEIARDHKAQQDQRAQQELRVMRLSFMIRRHTVEKRGHPQP